MPMLNDQLKLFLPNIKQIYQIVREEMIFKNVLYCCILTNDPGPVGHLFGNSS